MEIIDLKWYNHCKLIYKGVFKTFEKLQKEYHFLKTAKWQYIQLKYLLCLAMTSLPASKSPDILPPLMKVFTGVKPRIHYYKNYKIL